MKTNFLPLWAASSLLVLSLLTSCKEDLEDKALGAVSDVAQDSLANGFKKGNFRGMPIVYNEVDGQAMFEGDIMISSNDLLQDTNARTSGAGLADSYRWQNYLIPYEVGPGLNEDKLWLAMGDIDEKTPIQFVKRTTEKDYIRFEKDSRNCSNVGRIGGKQSVKLTTDNDVATITHALGHVIGLFHEHNRQDRDNYITINWDNIWENKREYFNRWPVGHGFDLGPFDYYSAMIYKFNEYSQNGKPTITEKGDNIALPSKYFTQGDIDAILSMYSSIYIVKNGSLFGLNPKDGGMVNLGAGWDGAAKSLAEDDQYIWGIQDGKLWKTNRYNGAYQQVGSDDWTGAKCLTGRDSFGNFYAVYNTKIWKVDKYGNRTKLTQTGQWGDAEALFYHNNALYVAIHNDLRKLSATTGTYQGEFNGVAWVDVRGIASMTSSSEHIYVLRGDALYRVSTVTGEVAGGEKFPGASMMTGAYHKLFLVTGDYLTSVTAYSEKKIVAKGLTGTTSIGSIGNTFITF